MQLDLFFEEVSITADIRRTSENSECALMHHKGTTIRYGQKQPLRKRQQGGEMWMSRGFLEDA